MNVYDVYRVMKECRNFFETGYVKSTFTINGGMLTSSRLFPQGAYIAIEGSVFYTGVYRMAADGVLEGIPVDSFPETFTGRIWFLRPPAGFLQLCKDVAEFDEKTPKGAYQSETFGEYSYTRAGGKNGGTLTWQEHFSGALAQYRNMFTEVMV